MGRRSNFVWPPEMDAQMLAMREEGKTGGQIARAVGRPYNSVEARIRNLLTRNPRCEKALRPRRCMKADCRKEFLPKYPGNYYCCESHKPGDGGAGISATGASMSGRGYVTRTRGAA